MPVNRLENIKEVTPVLKKVPITQGWAKSIIYRIFSKISDGRLVVVDNSSGYSEEFMEFGQSANETLLHAHIEIIDGDIFYQVLQNGITGSAEAYILGMWESPNLTDVVRLMVRNMDMLNEMDGLGSWVRSAFLKFFGFLHTNNLSGSKRNISAHYDLGNDFFKIFLDETMMYSSAIYRNGCTNLTEAANYKLDLICQKLSLNETHHVIEIGTGWGGFACYAAQNYGCRVTTTTISKQQYLKACERVKELGLEDKVTVLEKDYRVLEGEYDKLVSIEMIEAVGHEFYKEYFDKCSSLIKPNGQMLIQSILMNDQRYDKARKSIDFIKRYIFPGGCLPSYTEISKNITKYTDLQMMDVDDITYDYALTLADWRDRFLERKHEVERQGYDQSFIKMWEFYLCYCEGGFMERTIHTSQIVFAKPLWRHPEYVGRL